MAASRCSALLRVEAVGCRPLVINDGHCGAHAVDDAEVDVGVDDFREGGAWGHFIGHGDVRARTQASAAVVLR